jgi:flagellar hook-associated protein 2
MAYSAALQTVYNHYLQTYSNLRTSRHDAHKRGELRGIYNAIVEQNRKSPIFLLDHSTETHQFAVGLKENARELRNAITSLGGQSDGEVLSKKIAFSSKPEIVEATFIGEDDGGEFEIAVLRLATSQVNSGLMLPTNKQIELPVDSYSFDLAIGETNYEFQFFVNPSETNLVIQERLARLFNNSGLGLSAEVVHEDNHSSLRLQSDDTGLAEGRVQRFTISDDRTSKTAGAVSYLGLDNMTQRPGNAEYLLNGELASSHTNQFTIDNEFELRLTGISELFQGPAQIGIKNSIDSLNENIDSLIESYNNFLESTGTFDGNHFRGRQAMGEMRGIAARHRDEIGAIGLVVNEDGRLSWAEDDVLQTIRDDADDTDTLLPALDAVKSFTHAVLNKSNQITLNPMDYVDKKIIAYRNPARSLVNPYMTSIYSGMMFNSYC